MGQVKRKPRETVGDVAPITPPLSQPVSPLLLTVEEAARKLSICRDFMYRLLATPNPQVRSVKIGRSRRVPVSELEAYIERRLADAS
jgi:excisionase family DNA binding protein